MAPRISYFVVLCSSAIFLLLIPLHQFYSQNSSEFNRVEVLARQSFSWDSIPVANNLSTWVDCYPGRQCARLAVPLNYSEPTGRSASIALIRVPSPLQSTSAYRGPVLINPGGPGGSGIGTVRRGGDALSTLLGPQFDIVGFDPRGIGLSTPQATFFSSDAELALWGSPATDAIQLNASDDGVAFAHARALVTSRLAHEHDDGYLAHINTPNTARDMLQIVRSHGREKLLYWGFSYGTILGATFAAMFPDNVERLVIDGVADADNYYATLWSNNLIDTDKALQTFFDDCTEAGPDNCDFWAPSAAEISHNLTSLYNAIRKEPVATYTDTSYGIVDYSTLKAVVLASLYSPYAMFPKLATALSRLAAGDGAGILEFLPPRFECQCNGSVDVDVSNEATKTIACNDGVPMNDSIEDLREFYHKMAKMSDFAELWTLRLMCSGWPVKQDDLFRGPMVGNTSHPLLIIGNTADPVTPLWAAQKTSKGFPGSVVLTQDSPGHCSVAAVSLCTSLYIRAYFQDGTLPAAGTVCPVIGDLFPNTRGVDAQQAVFASMSMEERELVEAAGALRLAGIISPVALPL